jgi:hypothetical protein
MALMLSFASSSDAEFYRYQNDKGVTVFTDDLARVPENQRETASQYEDSPSLDVQNEGGAADDENGDQASLSDEGTSYEDQATTEEAQEVEDQGDSERIYGNDEGEAETRKDLKETEMATIGNGEKVAEPDAGQQGSVDLNGEGNAPEKNDGAAPKGRIDPDSLNQEKILLDKEYLSLLEEKEILERVKPDLKSKEEIQDYHEKIVNMNERISIYENHRKVYSERVDAYNSANSN